MSFDLTSSSADKCRRVPVFHPEDYCGWEMIFQAYVGFSEWELFVTVETELDATAYAALLTSSQDPSLESKKYEKQVESDNRKWKLNLNKVRQALIDSLCENKQTKLVVVEFQKAPPKEFSMLSKGV